ncbi:hypothetical protein GEMRC1_006219 [Eukaryota sp. GEM-RC1]
MSTLDFSDVYQHSRLSLFSPNDQFIASVQRHRLIVRKVDNLEIVNTFACQDAIQKIEWSYDSKLVLCGCFKRSLVHVFLITDLNFKCRIHDPIASIVNAFWSPDSRHVVTVADFQLRYTVWSLKDRSGRYISYPKFSDEKGYSFSKDGTLLAVLRRENCKDILSIYSIPSWDLSFENN